MRVVSLVPSWTETLIEAGVHVVGRTRFCIHPREKVAAIPVVGGTKRIQWPKLEEVRPDLLVLDREENALQMADRSPVPWVATHVTSVKDVPENLRKLSERLERPELLALGERWRTVCERITAESPKPGWLDLPGVIEWLRPAGPQVDQFLYLIWMEPWMAVGCDTFIGSMFELLGFGSRMCRLDEKYPTIRLEDYDPTRTLLLFSSEPYPFGRRRQALEELPFASALVNGESYSWYGIRALRFLEGQTRSPGR
ncbi:MAG TPA: helical backbone metal receptor [Phycisphaerae bacterium]|nr:helical backbone metal receptor [Phycisphaerae bacterium]